ncbi:MAG: type II toxin-antitoxin system RelE/ParE family toxin [Gemmatimonadaceae bacterium]|nr:type II toxin-antitoxin system RelE/ParE family toxin [Gemmatimonadaceae bacterium]
MRFVETPVFTSLLRAALSDPEYRALQLALVLRPEQGPVIVGSGGLRKLRWGTSGRGKRGGLRIIYYWDEPSETFYMLYLYAKNAQGDLTPAQVKLLRRVVEEKFR